MARTIGWTPRNGYLLASMLTGFFLSLALTFLLASGPGGIWTTIAPWVGSFAILTMERLTTRK